MMIISPVNAVTVSVWGVEIISGTVIELVNYRKIINVDEQNFTTSITQ